MGSGGSLLAPPLPDRAAQLLLAGQQELRRREPDILSLGLHPMYIHLAELRLGLDASAPADPALSDELLRFSKGEEDMSIFSIIEIQSSEELLKWGESEEVGDSPVIIVAECAGIDNLCSFSRAICSSQSRLVKLRGINIANNSIDAKSFDECDFFGSVDLNFLFVGGNQISIFASLSKKLTSSSLIVLDLSYTENLEIKPMDFFCTPQLQRLVLDGCNLSSTVVVHQEHGDISIFWGLVLLKELSLKENNLHEMVSFSGLQYFCFVPTDTSNYLSLTVQSVLSPLLQHVWIDENPYQSTKTSKILIEKYLFDTIPSLTHLDNRRRESVDINSCKNIDTVNILKRENVGGSCNIGGRLDSMEREYLAALKGEIDNTVVK